MEPPTPLAIQRFFAVTQGPKATSLYEVSHDTGLEIAMMFKKNLRGESKVTVGGRTGSGSKVLISRILSTYDTPEDQTGQFRLKFTGLPGDFFSGRTANVVGLFLTKEQALPCFDTTGELNTFDPRWLNESAETIRAIGSSHPVFTFAVESDYWPPNMEKVLHEITAH